MHAWASRCGSSAQRALTSFPSNARSRRNWSWNRRKSPMYWEVKMPGRMWTEPQWHAHSAVMDKHTSCKSKFALQMSPWLHSTNAATLIVPSTGKKADSAAFRSHKPFLVCNTFTLHGMSVQSTWNRIFTQRHGDFTCTLQFGWHLWSVQFYPYDDAMTGSAKHIRSWIWMC